MKELEFLASMYLESANDNTRREFLAEWNKFNSDKEDRIQRFRNHIEQAKYDELLGVFKVLMKANDALMFQSRFQGDLTDDVSYNEVILLARQHDKQKTAMRSELLEFYRNNDFSSGRPSSKLLLDIKDSVRIVKVESEQNDLSVLKYNRSKCIIAYVCLGYTDHFNRNENARVFFAFFYPDDQESNLLMILKHLQGFLSFHHDLKQRIERDFNGNLYGDRIEEMWRTDWLSIEKAGSHTDSTGVNRLIKDKASSNQSENILRILFEPTQAEPEHIKQFWKLLYNILIAMYYRSVISESDEEFFSANNITQKLMGIPSYSQVSDLINFKDDVMLSGIRLVCHMPNKWEDINSAHIYGTESVVEDDGIYFSGVPEIKMITFAEKYLRAFLVDILCNIEAHGKVGTEAEVYIEDRGEKPGYLVFKNQIDVNNTINDLDDYCKKRNYWLKQAIEYDYNDNTIPKGISLGCISRCMKIADNMVAYYSCDDRKCYFIIKLPIIGRRS